MAPAVPPIALPVSIRQKDADTYELVDANGVVIMNNEQYYPTAVRVHHQRQIAAALNHECPVDDQP